MRRRRMSIMPNLSAMTMVFLTTMLMVMMIAIPTIAV